MPCSSLVSPGLAALNTYRVHPLVRGDGYFYALDSTTFTYAFPGDISLGFGIFLAQSRREKLHITVISQQPSVNPKRPGQLRGPALPIPLQLLSRAIV